MLNELKRFIGENNLIRPGDRILLAVSGGIDSMVMAHLFLELGYKTAIAHCNFGLRGKDSDKDEELVRSFADHYRIPFHTSHFETKVFAKQKGYSVQMAARELRYDWFEKLMKDHRYDSVSVAHNLNDNAETILINLTRGTGIAGLTGMKPSSNKIIRPILFASRQEIVAYRDENNIQFREDRSNADVKYIRNKIRHQIIPLLREINPSVESTLNETAERFSGISEIVSDYITELRNRVTEHREFSTVFSINLLKEQIHNKAILFELFRPYGITNMRLNDLVKVIHGKTGGQILTGSHRIMKNRKEIIVSGEDAGDQACYTITDINGFKKIPGISSAAFIEITDTFEIPSDPFSACVDLEKIVFPLSIRRWKPGDYFYPLGMRHKKKLSDYFIDSKYSRLDKENKLILESAGKIVWILGDRIDNRFRISVSTKKALLIKATKKALKIVPVR
jgi:tRNA(Ile)-lysidine synthase